MSYLLDVNALLALLLAEHIHHSRTLSWTQGLARRHQANFLTCPITEIGFLRILNQTTAYNRSLGEAKDLLARAKQGTIVRFTFVPDDFPASGLPAWVVKPNQITDGYLLHLAKRHGSDLATLDEKIPGAFLIPRSPIKSA
jgi:predicted nucleic acid-binding protein